jgi:hypothetical protein
VVGNAIERDPLFLEGLSLLEKQEKVLQ